MTDNIGALPSARATSEQSPQAVSALRGGIANAGQPFATQWWEFLRRKSEWEDDFCDLLADNIEDYDKLGTDDYDGSLEICGATNDWRLSEVQQRYLANAGFYKVFVNHKDGWQTHYTFSNHSVPVRGWRRRYVSDASATTDRVMLGDPNPGYYEISFWPESWGEKDWLETGYMRLVPDPLDPFAQAMSARTAETEGLRAKPASAVVVDHAPGA